MDELSVEAWMKKELTNIERLKILTDQLTPSPQLIIPDTSFISYVKSPAGKIIVHGLYNSVGHTSISLVIAEAGSSMVSHTHDEREFVYIIQGHLLWNVGGKIFDLKRGDVRYALANTPHDAVWPEYTEMLCWTIPDNKLWPKGIESKETPHG